MKYYVCAIVGIHLLGLCKSGLVVCIGYSPWKFGDTTYESSNAEHQLHLYSIVPIAALT